MVKKDWDELMDHYGSDATSELPLTYCLRGTRIETFPVGTVARTLKFTYYGADTAPTDAEAENLWMLHASDLLLAGTGVAAAGKHTHDPELAAAFSAEQASSYARLMVENTARAEAGRSRRMG